MVRLPRLVLTMSLGILVACTTWQRVAPPRAGVTPNLSGEIRVTRTDGATYVLTGARVEGDSVIGQNSVGTRVAVASQDISTLERRQVSQGRTAGAVVGSAGLVVIIVAVVAALVLAASLGSGY